MLIASEILYRSLEYSTTHPVKYNNGSFWMESRIIGRVYVCFHLKEFVRDRIITGCLLNVRAAQGHTTTRSHIDILIVRDTLTSRSKTWYACTIEEH